MFDRRLLKNFDFGLLIICIVISLIGVLAIYSSTHFARDTDLYTKQLAWLGTGIILLLCATFINYRILWEAAYPIYIVSIILLLGVAIFGKIALGAQRWFKIGAYTFQPSEFAKLAFIVILARYLSPEGMKRKINKFKDLLFPVLLLALPFLLTMLQPDLGSACVFIFIFFGMLFFAGAKFSHLLTLVCIGIGFIPFAWFFLRDYQRARLMVFFDPSRDPLASGYHIIQSKITIGSGRFFGKGFLNGSQTQLRFIPKQHTDFIFSVIGEEFGFLGTSIVILLFFLFIYRAMKSASTKDMFGKLLSVGIISSITFQIFVNLAMSVSLAPVTGLPLPLLSYGGSSLVSTLIGVGIILNVRMRKFMF